MTRTRTWAAFALALAGCDASADDRLTTRDLIEVKLVADDGGVNDLLAASVAIDGDIAVVGALGDGDLGANSGSAYVFSRTQDGWTLDTKLRASDGTVGDRFGISVAVSGDTIVVGAPDEGGDVVETGAAYVYVREQGRWRQQAKLTASDGKKRDLFGAAVAISGNVVVGGAPSNFYYADRPGKAYVFERTAGSWRQSAILQPSDGKPADMFGSSLAVHGNTIAIGAPRSDPAGSSSGSVYVYERRQLDWVEQTKLWSSHDAPGDRLGHAVDVQDNIVVAGAYLADSSSAAGEPAHVADTGAVYVFERERDVWRRTSTVRATDSVTGDGFGRAVAVYDGLLIAGAPGTDHHGEGSGSTYVFARQRDAWSLQFELTASAGNTGDNFGYAVDVSAQTFAIGAWLDGERAPRAGALYTYTVRADDAATPPWNQPIVWVIVVLFIALVLLAIRRTSRERFAR